MKWNEVHVLLRGEEGGRGASDFVCCGAWLTQIWLLQVCERYALEIWGLIWEEYWVLTEWAVRLILNEVMRPWLKINQPTGKCIRMWDSGSAEISESKILDLVWTVSFVRLFRCVLFVAQYRSFDEHFILEYRFIRLSELVFGRERTEKVSGKSYVNVTTVTREPQGWVTRPTKVLLRPSTTLLIVAYNDEDPKPVNRSLWYINRTRNSRSTKCQIKRCTCYPTVRGDRYSHRCSFLRCEDIWI